MVNVQADFNDLCTEATFKALKWRMPLEAVKALQIEPKGPKADYYKLTVYFDKDRMNSVMRMYGQVKDQKKDKRALKFVDLGTLRDFAFHLKRLYHFHRRSKPAIDANKEGPPLTITDTPAKWELNQNPLLLS